MSWLASDKWPVLAERLLAAGEAGIDCETYNQPDKTSPQHRAKVHCWSLGLLSNKRTARGFRQAFGVVLPHAALHCEPLLAALRSVTLYAHNAPHDIHSLANEGVELDIVDSLQWIRVAVPGMRFYGLKDCEQWALGYPPRPSFLDHMKHTVEETTIRTRKDRACVCGKRPCRARSTSEWFDSKLGWFRLHEREDVVIETPVTRTVERRYEVPDFVPGAQLQPMPDGSDRLEAWWEYSKVDAVRGIELVDWIRTRKASVRQYPWQPLLCS